MACWRAPGGLDSRGDCDGYLGRAAVDNAVDSSGFALRCRTSPEGGARIVDESDQNVWRLGRKPARPPMLIDRLLHRSPGNAGRGRWREWKGLLPLRSVLRVSHSSSPGLCVRRCQRSNGAVDLGSIRAAITYRHLARLGRQFGHQNDAGDERCEETRQNRTASLQLAPSSSPPSDW
jgi:hypothetical protein